MIPFDTGSPIPAQRSLRTARSVEFDALIVTAAPPPGPDAVGSLDAKAASGPAASDIDPRVASSAPTRRTRQATPSRNGSPCSPGTASGTVDRTGHAHRTRTRAAG